MAHPSYYVDDVRVPSVTTVIGCRQEAGGLIAAANKLGLEGKTVQEEWYGNAATLGSIVHERVEAFIRNRKPDLSGYPKDLISKSRTAMRAFLEWWEQTNLSPVKTEVSLVSKKFRYGGTLDAFQSGPKRFLFDWKTSKHLNSDYIIQIAAYRQLWNENFPRERVHMAHLVRFGKEDGDFEHRLLTKIQLDRGWEAFMCLREIYDLQKELKKVIR